MLVGLLESLGLGGSMLTAAMLVLVVLYIRRAARAGSMAAGFASATVAYAMVVLGVAAVSIVLGWVDPHPGVIFEHLRTGASWGWEVATGPAREVAAWLRGVIPL